jgi:D-3-phosphoglycerate dehydrogenase
MATILIAESRFSDDARRVLEKAGEVVSFEAFNERLGEADAIVAGLDMHLRGPVLDRAARLRVIASRTSQLRHVDLDETRRRGIEVLFIDPADPLLQKTSSTAEETMALVLALARRLPWAFDALKQGRWARSEYGGIELKGKTIGLIGFGRLGRMVARYAQAFELAVLANDPRSDPVEVRAAGAEPVSLAELLERSDIVSVHCTYSNETERLLRAEHFRAMRPTALFVNTSRGEITDEGALLEALETGAIAGAAVDTLAGERPDGSHLRENALVEYARTHESLIILPHLGGATAEATERTQLYISRRLVDYLKENPL